ncbi:hypothetical protein [Bradyrhizobium sp. WSM1417]|uniref:hypothetical protein n=1 Tax=Bradyrhizobium sp. WSM1417 TaxID=754500 RepID=UPI0012EC9AF1|nr:hypothetical protein [Bradyrhizobium sp. WSM1417]
MALTIVCLGVALAESTVSSQAVEGRCLIVMDGRTFLKGRCNIEIHPGGSFTVGVADQSSSKYFAYVSLEGTPLTAHGYWNGVAAESHAHSDLGPLRRKGACWSNRRAKVCAWH